MLQVRAQLPDLLRVGRRNAAAWRNTFGTADCQYIVILRASLRWKALVQVWH
jgi:hypothetical protein